MELNETSMEAAVREGYEETGYQFEIDRLVYVQERFTSFHGKRHHEIVFFYLMKNHPDLNIPEGTETDQKGIEALYWVSLADLPNVNIVPAFLKSALQDIPDHITHIISKE